MPFVEQELRFTLEVDKTSICEVDFLVNLAVLFAKDGANEVLKGLEITRRDHCCIISERMTIARLGTGVPS